MKTFTPKTPTEIEFFAAKFQLQDGETIESADVQVLVVEGDDPAAADMISGDVLIEEDKVSVPVTGGRIGVTYSLMFVATTSLGQRLEEYGSLSVVEGSKRR